MQQSCGQAMAPVTTTPHPMIAFLTYVLLILLVSPALSIGYNTGENAEEENLNFDINSSKPQVRHYGKARAGSVLAKSIRFESNSVSGEREIQRRLVAYDLDAVFPPYDNIQGDLVIKAEGVQQSSGDVLTNSPPGNEENEATNAPLQDRMNLDITDSANDVILKVDLTHEEAKTSAEDVNVMERNSTQHVNSEDIISDENHVVQVEDIMHPDEEYEEEASSVDDKKDAVDDIMELEYTASRYGDGQEVITTEGEVFSNSAVDLHGLNTPELIGEESVHNGNDSRKDDEQIMPNADIHLSVVTNTGMDDLDTIDPAEEDARPNEHVLESDKMDDLPVDDHIYNTEHYLEHIGDDEPVDATSTLFRDEDTGDDNREHNSSQFNGSVLTQVSKDTTPQEAGKNIESSIESSHEITEDENFGEQYEGVLDDIKEDLDNSIDQNSETVHGNMREANSFDGVLQEMETNRDTQTLDKDSETAISSDDDDAVLNASVMEIMYESNIVMESDVSIHTTSSEILDTNPSDATDASKMDLVDSDLTHVENHDLPLSSEDELFDETKDDGTNIDMNSETVASYSQPTIDDEKDIDRDMIIKEDDAKQNVSSFETDADDAMNSQHEPTELKTHDTSQHDIVEADVMHPQAVSSGFNDEVTSEDLPKDVEIGDDTSVPSSATHNDPFQVLEQESELLNPEKTNNQQYVEETSSTVDNDLVSKEFRPQDRERSALDYSVPKSTANDEFVHGLDDLHKFLEEVDPPDELDVGASGLSIQEVLLGQGVTILKTRVQKGLYQLQSSLKKLRSKGTQQWNKLKDMIDDNFDINLDEATLSALERMEQPYQKVKEFLSSNRQKLNSLTMIFRRVGSKFESLFSRIGIIDNDEEDYEDFLFDDLQINDDDLAEMRKKLMSRYK